MADRGITHFYANAGTDFAPLIEAFAKGAKNGANLPRPILVPHENVAVSMAMGHALVGGGPQAVMVHVNVGTANALCGLLNAHRGRVPMLFMAGRTPIHEEGRAGARSSFVHWPQEMFDQAGMVREAVKWDYELRDGAQLETVIDRALTVASSSPAGPAYLTLPREVLATTLDSFAYQPGRSRQSASRTPAAAEADVAELAEALRAARDPLIVTSSLGRNAGAVNALSRLALEQAIAVVSYNPRFMELPSNHPMNMGQDVSAALERSDLVIVVEAVVPWMPGETRPPVHAKVVHIGEDPLFTSLPVRSFPCDLAITADPALALTQLADVLASDPASPDLIAHRHRQVGERRAALLARRQAAWRAVENSSAITPLHISRAIDTVKGDALVFKESGLRLDQMHFNEPGTMFFSGAAGGLGWSLGAALGAKLAAPERTVISTVGDGSYMFGTPLAAHYVAAEQQLPVLFVVFNNGGWHAVRRSTRGMYADGHAAEAGHSSNEPLTDFGVGMNYEKMMDVVGGHGEKLERPEELAPALSRAMEIMKTEKRQVLLNVVCTT
ncbi:hypothetical protein A3840_17985 [Devosia elaeis]|uniref:Acetolactate synthase n=1 Tax=Devosia elaeis TaxID=1770058 RepID=A0A178HNE6_9HYPH|nr:hypothetical protein A3840_17985 [Devosia elaeis]